MKEVSAYTEFTQQFRIECSSGQGRTFPFEGTDLLTAAGIARIIKETGDQIGAPKPYAAGSLFVKRHYCLVPIAALYCLSKLNSTVVLTPDNLSFSFNKKKQWCTLLKNGKMASCPPSGREQWKSKALHLLFKKTVGPVFRAVTDYTGVAVETLWAHLAFAVHHWYGVWINEAALKIERTRITDDFHFLIEDAPPEWFEGVNRNPFADDYTYVSHPKEKNCTIRLRKKCCFNYCLPEGLYCYTCPGLTEEQRIHRIMET